MLIIPALPSIWIENDKSLMILHIKSAVASRDTHMNFMVFEVLYISMGL